MYVFGHGLVWRLANVTRVRPGAPVPLQQLSQVMEETTAFALATTADNAAICVTGGMREVYYGEDPTEELSNNAWLYDIEKNTFSKLAPLREARQSHSSTAL